MLQDAWLLVALGGHEARREALQGGVEAGREKWRGVGEGRGLRQSVHKVP